LEVDIVVAEEAIKMIEETVKKGKTIIAEVVEEEATLIGIIIMTVKEVKKLSLEEDIEVVAEQIFTKLQMTLKLLETREKNK
jgi:hypothetical protein